MQIRCSRKIGRSMPKCLPKSLKIDQKSDLEASNGHLFSFFLAFWRDSKKHDFLIRFKWPKKSDKSDQQAARMSQRIPGPSAKAWFSGLWAPGRRLFTHALASGKVKDGSWPVRKGKRQEGKFASRTEKGKKRDLTRQ